MRNDWRTNNDFWRHAVLTAVTLAGLTVAARASTVIYRTPHCRFLAMMIGVLRSRAVLVNPGVTGYYERLAGGAAQQSMSMPEEVYFRTRNAWSHDRIYDRSFRIFRLKPNLPRLTDGVTTNAPTNSAGWVGREHSLRKPSNTRRVALLGDSVAMGWGVDLSQSFATLLEDHLNTPSGDGTPQRFEVLNFSVFGYTLTQILDVQAEEAPRFEPDVYVLALTELGVHRNWDEHLVRVVEWGIDPKYDFLRETVGRAGASRRESPLILFGKLAPFRIPVLREIFIEMKSRAAHDHVPFLVVLVPSVEDGDLTRERFHGIPELLASLDIPVVDLLDTFDGIPDVESLRLTPEEIHPNARGHAMIFENLWTKLQAQPDAWAALAGTVAERADRTKVSPTGKSFQESVHGSGTH